MRHDDCVKLDSSGDLLAGACKGPFLVFGPYLQLEDGTEVEVTFDAQAEGDVNLFSDIVSGKGARVHAALLPEAITSDEARRFSYRVRLDRPVIDLEARVAIESNSPVTLEIRDFRLRIVEPPGGVPATAKSVTAPAAPSGGSR